ncbi:MAG: hypothetical protein II874_02405 [Bacteroidales bacterium]|nr:hypothetical protein [Bacteroidales bacterium]
MNANEFLTTIGICVVLPVLIVWIVGRVRQNATNRKAEIMLKAIESGVEIKPDLFKTSRPKKASIKKGLLEKLNGACITGMLGFALLLLMLLGSLRGAFANYLPLATAMLLAVSAGLFVSYFAGKKMLAKEIEAEEKDLLEEK